MFDGKAMVRVRTHGNQKRTWQMPKRTSSSIKADMELTNIPHFSMARSAKGKSRATQRSSSLPPETPNLVLRPLDPEAPPPTPASTAAPPQQDSNAQGPTANPTAQAATPSQASGPAPGLTPESRTARYQVTESSTEYPCIRRAFPSAQTTNYFVSVYGRNRLLVDRLFHIGSVLDSIVAARQLYLAVCEEAEGCHKALERALPGDATPGHVWKQLQRSAPDRFPANPTVGQPTTSRPPPTFGSSANPHPRPAPPPASRPSQPPRLDSQHQAATPQRANPTPNAPVRVDTPRPRAPQCRHAFCRRNRDVDHRMSECPKYVCEHCRLTAPGHLPQYCPSNPHRGPARRTHPSVALGTPSGTTLRPTTAETQATAVTSPATGANTTSHRRRRMGSQRPPSPPPATSVANGPTYRPTFRGRMVPRGASQRGRGYYGRLSTSVRVDTPTPSPTTVVTHAA